MNFEIAPKSTEIEANWDDARLYCFSLAMDGKTGWRLPTKDELNEIYQSENDFTKNWWHWSSTTDTDEKAHGLDFGDCHPCVKHKYLNARVRAVRTTV